MKSMSKENDIDGLMYKLNNMIDQYTHKVTGKSLYTVRKERVRKERIKKESSIVNNNRKQ